MTWPRTRLKYTCSVNPPAPRVEDDQDVTFVPMEAVQERGGIDTSTTRPAAKVRSGYTAFAEGDVLVAKITPCFENGKGSIAEGLLGGVGFGTTELHVLRPSDCDRRWLFYVTQTHEFMGHGEGSMYGAGGQKRVPPEFVKDFRAPTPDLPNQRAIADFLDRKTAAIDALIEKKERLLELLAEKRAALIHRAVTKGLDPDVPMKDSGVPWIGEIPAHWNPRTKLQSLTGTARGAFVNGPFGSDLLAEELTKSGVPVVYIRDITPLGYRRKSTVCVTPEKADQLDVCRVDPGDVVVSKVGSPPGDACVYPEGEPAGVVTQDVIRLKLTPSHDAAYIAMFLNSPAGREVVAPIIVESTRARVALGDFKRLRVPLPPLAEQRAIVSSLTPRLAALDGLRDKLRNQMDLAREYRQALITAAVTGQFDIEA